MHLTIAMLTYRRNDYLAQVIPELLAQADDVSDARTTASVPIVDNDPQAGARAVVEAARAALAGEQSEAAEPSESADSDAVATSRLVYVHEPEPGIVAGRNRALSQAHGSDALVFIDDDEEPEPGWLAALVGLWASTGCQAVAGPVIPVYEVEPEAWVRQGEFFVRRTWPTGTVRPVAASNCLLLDLGFVRRAGLRFDEAFGATGGEDTLFTRRLSAAGGVIRWCDEARVRDHVPASRLTRPWILRRQRSHAATSVRVELALAGGGAQPAIRARAAAGGLVRIVVGGLRTAGGTLIRSPQHAAKGARLLARGRGILAASVGGGVHREYDH